MLLNLALPISRAVMAALPDCRLVVRWGVGYDTIDVAAATQLGIAVSNCPTWCTEDVSDHAVALILNSVRKMAWLDQQVRAGRWPWQEYRPIHRLRGQTLGLVGFGRIGGATGRKMSALGLRLLAYDPYLDPPHIRARGAEPVELDVLMATADIVSVHIPLLPTTFHLIGERELRRMKPTAYLINTSRGAVIDEGALVRALSKGWIAGAGLDVFEQEPLPPESLLRTMPNVVMTPHSAGYSEEAVADWRREMCDIVSTWFAGGWPESVVNPEVRSRLRERASPPP